MRKTKIICTLGPASSSEEVLTAMCRAGLDAARLNFSHGSHDEHLEKVKLVRRVREKTGLPIPIILDTKGPEYRIGCFTSGKITLTAGQEFIFTTDDVAGDENRVSVSCKNLNTELSAGDCILVNDGMIECTVKEVKGSDIITEVVYGGELSDRKGMNFPGRILPGPFLSEQDKSDLLWGIEQEVDFVAASFVSTGDDAKELRQFLDGNGGSRIEIIAKIENQSGIDNIEEISKYVDGIMVARGDLGVEIPFVEVPSVQHDLVARFRSLNKRVVVATEMLESMIDNPRPTRAEISDIATAVTEGASAIMLSGETAMGAFPVEAVRTMAEAALATERHINYEKIFRRQDYKTGSLLDAITHSACRMAVDVSAKCIIINTVTGHTARMISRFRNPVQIVAITADSCSYRKLALIWGVLPVLYRADGSTETPDSLDERLRKAIEFAKTQNVLASGDKIILIGSGRVGEAGSNNTIRLETVE